MLKFLFLVFVIGFIFFRLLGFFMRLLTGSPVGQKTKSNPYGPYQRTNGHSSRPSDGNVSIDFVPSDNKKKRGDKFRGGEYVDYEEIED